MPQNTAKQDRASNGKFVKGKSGNPGGRPKEVAHVVELARKHTVPAINTLAEIMGNKDETGRARAAAAEALLSRGWGKPIQQIEGTGPNGEHAFLHGFLTQWGDRG